MNNEILDETAKEAEKGANKNDGGPFGAIIADKDGNIIARGHNKVLDTHDPTAHAEIVAIREACKKIGTHDLSGYIMYSSCEPCPMCLSAIIWSNIKKIYFGANRKDAADAGFRDDDIYEFIKGNNRILREYDLNNEDCKKVLENYDGEIY